MMMKSRWNAFYCGILQTLLISQVIVAGDNWPSFRGPTNDGISDAKDLPVEWSESKNIQWKTGQFIWQEKLKDFSSYMNQYY